MAILKCFLSYSLLCYICFHVILSNFCDNIHRFSIQFLGFSYKCIFCLFVFVLMRKSKMDKKILEKSQLTVFIMVTLDSMASTLNTVIIYQEKQNREENISKVVAVLKDSATGGYNLYSCCLHMGLPFQFFLFLFHIKSVPCV